MDMKLLLSSFIICQVTIFYCQASYRCNVKYNWTHGDPSICFLVQSPALYKTYKQSVSYCKSLHPDMHLPITKDRSTLKFLTDELETSGLTSGFWLGAKASTNFNFSWVDGTDLSSTSKLWGDGEPSGNAKCVYVQKKSQDIEIENNIKYRTLDDVYCYNAKRLVVCSCQTVKVQELNGTDELFSKSPTLNEFKDVYASGVENGGDPVMELDSVGLSAAKKLLNSSKTEVSEIVETESFKLELKKFEVSNFQGATFSSTKQTALINVPKSILQLGKTNSSKYAATVGIAYSTKESDVTIKNQSQWKLNSDVLSYSVVYDNLNFTEPVVLTFLHKSQKNDHKNAVCAFWDVKTKSWSQEGCHKVVSNSSLIICHCYHLTVFASLMQVVPDKEIDQFSESEAFAVGTITYICFALSYAGLCITIAAHSSSKILKKECNFIRMNLCISIFLAQTVFLSGIDKTGNQAACKFLAFLLHYAYLTVGCWMLAEGISIVLMTSRVVQANDSRWKYCLLGWATPLLLAGACFAALHKSYGHEQACWLKIEGGAIWAFTGPMLLIILFNICALIVAVKATLSVRINRKKSEKERVRVGIKAMFVLLPLLGLTWITGLFAVGSAAKPMQILFSIFNALQGFFIFIFHCMKNSEIRKSNFAKKTLGRISTISNNKVFASPMARLQIKGSAQQNSSLKTQTIFSVAADDVVVNNK